MDWLNLYLLSLDPLALSFARSIIEAGGVRKSILSTID